MDDKYLAVSLSNDLEWSKQITTMTNKANSKLSILRRNLKGCPEKLKQTVLLTARFVKVAIQDTLVFLICLMSLDGPAQYEIQTDWSYNLQVWTVVFP